MSTSGAALAAAEGGALGLHKAIPHPGSEERPETRAKCERWPAHMRLLNETTGELIEGRCKAANQCPYCRNMARLENTKLLGLDALDGNPPTVWLVLGTRTATMDSDVFDEGVRLAMRAIRRRWPAAEYVAMVEYTTGYGPKAGGRRRPHLNVALKNVPADAIEELRQVVVPVWCRHVDAAPHAQFAGEITDGAGLFGYWADHFSKKGQEPPEGWRGHRLRMSRGYLSMPTPEARKRARAELARARHLWRAQAVLGLTGEAVADYADAQEKAAEEASWRLYDIEGVALVERNRSAPRPDRTAAPAAPAPRKRSGGACAPERPRASAEPIGPEAARLATAAAVLGFTPHPRCWPKAPPPRPRDLLGAATPACATEVRPALGHNVTGWPLLDRDPPEPLR